MARRGGRAAGHAVRAVGTGLPRSASVARHSSAGRGHTVRAPLVGTFYRSPEPGAPPFAEVGDVVRVGQQLAVIEAMKLMNAIEADRDGRVTAVLIDNAQGVEFDQPLFELDPEYDGGTHPDPSPESAATAPVTPVTPVAPEPNVGR